MNKNKRSLFNFLLGAVSCLFMIGIPTFSLSNQAATLPLQNLRSASSSPTQQSQTAPPYSVIDQHLTANLREADAVLIAQGASTSSATRFVAVMTKGNIVPSAPTTSAFGAAGAVLSGDRLIVRGDFSNLSSPLRDYSTDPLSPPNPNVTSAIHIHRGEPTANGPFQYALQVTPDESGLKGRFAGEYTLTGEQLQALSEGKLYVDLHTKQNRAGELRGVLQAY